jgi:hypothetical protein
MVVVAVQAGVELDGIAGILIAAPVVDLTLVVRRVITAAFVRRCIDGLGASP